MIYGVKRNCVDKCFNSIRDFHIFVEQFIGTDLLLEFDRRQGKYDIYVMIVNGRLFGKVELKRENDCLTLGRLYDSNMVEI